MKLLGIDYGMKRIGLATTDESQTIATPLLTIQNKGDKKNIIALSEIVKSHDIKGIVFGIPQNSSGEDTPMTKIVRDFGNKLSAELGMEVVFVNERYSSKEAEDHIRENLGITKREKIAELIDKMSASLILKSYIEK